VLCPFSDKQAHFQSVQKMNILDSVVSSSSLHSLLATKQRVVLDFLPYLMDIISPPPAIRPLPLITLPEAEQLAIIG
jgi:hypothetical protein